MTSEVKRSVQIRVRGHHALGELFYYHRTSSAVIPLIITVLIFSDLFVDLWRVWLLFFLDLPGIVHGISYR